ncbi:biotin/lipoyl-binding protein [Acidobacteria bacterium AH-259-O06]|nr:biotin/lipoyl-binding protein [Acidobacteria bacterium AH-259-O06]
MKLEAQYDNQTYLIELEERDSPEQGSYFEIKIHRPDGEQVLPVRVLSRSQGRWTLEIKGKIEDVLVTETAHRLLIDWRNRTFSIQIYSLKDKLRLESVRPHMAGVASLRAQMPGKVIAVLAAEGQRVEVGQGLLIIEAMKMQNELRSPKSGTVRTCKVRQGERVNPGDLLFEIE